LHWVDPGFDNLKAYPNAENAVTVHADQCKKILDRAASAMNKDLRYNSFPFFYLFNAQGCSYIFDSANRPLEHSSPSRLLLTFRSCGLTGCIEEQIASDRDPSTRADYNKIVMVGFEGISNILLAAGGIEGMENKEQRDELVKSTWEELVDLKAFWRNEIFVVVGRKALT
jgi:hypothetical protein